MTRKDVYMLNVSKLLFGIFCFLLFTTLSKAEDIDRTWHFIKYNILKEESMYFWETLKEGHHIPSKDMRLRFQRISEELIKFREEVFKADMQNLRKRLDEEGKVGYPGHAQMEALYFAISVLGNLLELAEQHYDYGGNHWIEVGERYEKVLLKLESIMGIAGKEEPIR